MDHVSGYWRSVRLQCLFFFGISFFYIFKEISFCINWDWVTSNENIPIYSHRSSSIWLMIWVFDWLWCAASHCFVVWTLFSRIYYAYCAICLLYTKKSSQFGIRYTLKLHGNSLRVRWSDAKFDLKVINLFWLRFWNVWGNDAPAFWRVKHIEWGLMIFAIFSILRGARRPRNCVKYFKIHWEIPILSTNIWDFRPGITSFRRKYYAINLQTNELLP